ncbi:conserved hypothetical protein [Oceanicaulis sp. 350]|nr:conserved hypothetical protein [Oceanicaulis sp. 350]
MSDPTSSSENNKDLPSPLVEIAQGDEGFLLWLQGVDELVREAASIGLRSIDRAELLALYEHHCNPYHALDAITEKDPILAKMRRG